MVEAGYPIAQCDVCDCANGQAVRRLWAVENADRQQKRLNQLFSGAGIPAHFRGFTLDTMIERAGRDPGKQAAIEAVIAFVNGGVVLDRASKRYKPGIILSGSFGVGKTGILTPALNRLVADGKSGLWVEVYDFLSTVQAGYASGDSDAKLTAAQTADVILLDDLGDVDRNAEETADRRRIIYQLINHRHNESLPMLITTNCNAPQLAQQFGARTLERIMESCAWVTMAGANLRGL